MGRPTLDQLGLLGLFTETPLHCGAESGTGYVDQPIQRERHTGFPVIPGSTLKGVLRDEMKVAWSAAGDAAAAAAKLRAVFGSDDPDHPSPGQVSFGDGILVAFPVRSSAAPFHWVTCPLVLERLSRCLGVAVDVAEPAAGACRARGDGEVLLEEIRLVKSPDPAFFAEADSGLAILLSLLPRSENGFAYTRSIFPDRLLVLSDADFRELTETGTEVLTRIKLTALGTTTDLADDEHPEITGADRKGNMFVQEVVPPETLFACPLRATASGVDLGRELAALDVVRVGGDETVGRGITHLAFLATAGDGR